jgi:hypothetical protein
MEEIYICLTNSGTTNTSGYWLVYTNVDNFSQPLAQIPVWAPITNCPYSVLIPEIYSATTQIRLIDDCLPGFCVSGSGCCVVYNFSEGFNICEACGEIDFDVKTDPSVGRISVGNLTGSCGNFNNYYLQWLQEGEVAGLPSYSVEFFQSGSGSTSSLGNNYNYRHPLTGSSSPYMYAAEYQPIILEAAVNGVNYSYTQGLVGNCFSAKTLTVLPWTATNGNSGGDYTHVLTFTSTTANDEVSRWNGGSSIQGLTIELSANTKYVPIRIKTSVTPKKFLIHFSGSSGVDNFRRLESIVLGGNLSEQNSYLTAGIIPGYSGPFRCTNVTPGTGDTFVGLGTMKTDGYFTKVLCLTGLTVNEGDKLFVMIEPQAGDCFVCPGPPYPAGSANSTWEFDFIQKPSFSCDSCITGNNFYKLSASSFSTSITTCNKTTVSFAMSGCSTGIDDNTDIYKYVLNDSAYSNIGQLGYGPNGVIQTQVDLGDIDEVNCVPVAVSAPQSECISVSSRYLIPNNSTFEIFMEVANVTSIRKRIVVTWIGNNFGQELLYNDWSTAWNTIQSSIPIESNPQNVNYWRIFNVILPTPNFATVNCEQVAGEIGYTFHYNTTTVNFENDPTYVYNGTPQGKFSMTIEGELFSSQPSTIENQLLTDFGCLSLRCVAGGVFEDYYDDVANSVTGTTLLYPTTPLNPLGQTIIWANNANIRGTVRQNPFVIGGVDLSTSEDTSSAATISNIVSISRFQLETYTGQKYKVIEPQYDPTYFLKGYKSWSYLVDKTVTANTCPSFYTTTFNPFSGDSSLVECSPSPVVFPFPSYWLTPNRNQFSRYKFYYEFEKQTNIADAYNIYTYPIGANGNLSLPRTLIAQGTGSTLNIVSGQGGYFV